MTRTAERSGVVALAALVLPLCFTLACQNRTTMAELEKYRAEAAIERQNEALVKRVFDALNKRDAAIYENSYAPKYGWHFPANNPKGLSREEEAGFVKLLWVGFPDIQWTIEEATASGDTVVARFKATGTHTGEYQGLRPTGNRFETGGVWTARIKDGKVVVS